MTKTKAAFFLTVENVFRSAKGKGHKVYLWTFTFFVAQSDWDGSRMFSSFLHELRRPCWLGSGWGGVKVVELHKEHGVHFHALFTERVAIDIVREVASHYGIGRVQVERADEGTAKYLSKYLSKKRAGPRTESGRGLRRWAAFGDIERTRVADLVNESPMWVHRRAKGQVWLNSFADEKLLTRTWDHGPAAFDAAYAALSDFRGRGQDACAIAEGRLEARGVVTLVKPMPQGVAPF